MLFTVSNALENTLEIIAQMQTIWFIGRMSCDFLIIDLWFHYTKYLDGSF